MGHGYLIDTNTVIDFLNRKLPVKGKNLVMAIEPVISVITQIELYSSDKLSVQELWDLDSFIRAATIYNYIDEQIVKHAINIRKTYKRKTPDAIIAATALTHNLTLITRNIRDFNSIIGLDLINPWD